MQQQHHSHTPGAKTRRDPFAPPPDAVQYQLDESDLSDTYGLSNGLSDGAVSKVGNFLLGCIVLTGTVGGILYIGDRFKVAKRVQKMTSKRRSPKRTKKA